ncbi:MAG TPA: hypothetical protein VNH19_08880 [Candidatus Limnocylindrales bacterium]|nr:hypothetical protein [Candidatus Limnocylindrales bacterium]
MDDNQNRTYQRAVRVREFNAQRLVDFSETGVARQFFNDLIAAIADAKRLGEAQTTGIGQARQGTLSRRDARAAVQRAVDAIFRIARAMGLEAQFQRPANGTDEALLNTARSYATNALPLKARFIAYDVPADFIDDLNEDIAELEAAIANQGSAVGDHVSASAELEDALDRCDDAVRKEDPIMKNKYADDPGSLAEWISASHIERAPRRKKTPPTPVTSVQ